MARNPVQGFLFSNEALVFTSITHESAFCTHGLCDIVCFNHNTMHAAFGGSARRRMFTMNLCQRYPQERLQELRDYLCGGARFWVARGYGQAMVETAGPERQVHLDPALPNDGHLAALSARARAEMAEPARG